MATVDLGLVKGDKGDKGDTGAKGERGDTGGTFTITEKEYYDINTLKTEFISLIGAGFSRLLGIYEQNLTNYKPISQESVTFKETNGTSTSVSFYDRSGTEITSLSASNAKIVVVYIPL